VPAPFDQSDFVDAEYQPARRAPAPEAGAVTAARPPTQEELETRVHETQQRLEELRRIQEKLEQERASLEEARRRRGEYHTGRTEMIEQLTRGIGLLEEAELTARREAQQMSQALHDLREHLTRVENLNDQLWTQENYVVEMTRALTAIENARLEWNGARLKWPRLNPAESVPAPGKLEDGTMEGRLAAVGFVRLCRYGLALTWPVAVAVLLAAGGVALAWWVWR
jgi:exonuclease VII large subunit